MSSVVFGKYTLLRRLAQGGMAELYLGRSHKSYGVERMVVIKVIASRFAADASFAKMFSDEVRISATLTHPNIGQVVDVGEVEGRQYLAMEYLHGKDMRVIVRALKEVGQRGVPYGVAVLAGSRICAALNYAHEARNLDGERLGIIHRDVSPSNIMVTFDGQVKLLDFGIAKAAHRSSLTQPGMVKGKVRYLSPEQLMGEAIDHRTDIFTLGISLWECTVGEHLFEGAQDVQVYDAISSGRIRPPSSLVPDYPPELERVLMRALAPSPADRYPNTTAMQADLERYARNANFALSELQVASFLRELYVEEYMSWEEAKSEGVSVLDYLVSQADSDDMRLGGVLAGEDIRKTRISSSVPSVVGNFNATSANDAEPSGTIRKTILFGETPLPPIASNKAQQSASGPITLSGAGSGPSNRGPSNRGVSAAPTKDPSEPSLRVADGSAVEITRDGRGSVVPTPTSAPLDRDNARMTLMNEDDPSALTLPPVDDEGRAPIIASSPGALAMEKTTASDRKLAELQEARPVRPATGDWSQKGQQHAGTHPYFKGDPSLPEPSGKIVPFEALELPRKRWPLFLALALVGLSVLGVAAWGVWKLTNSQGVTNTHVKAKRANTGINAKADVGVNATADMGINAKVDTGVKADMNRKGATAVPPVKGSPTTTTIAAKPETQPKPKVSRKNSRTKRPRTKHSRPKHPKRTRPKRPKKPTTGDLKDPF
ncbi:MAG: serine/threonine protein kinase [Deltaproteobacteria bacterium]|nr:serine/threonine protein kinase [Deltaproteobacteria bacterium]